MSASQCWRGSAGDRHPVDLARVAVGVPDHRRVRADDRRANLTGCPVEHEEAGSMRHEPRGVMHEVRRCVVPIMGQVRERPEQPRRFGILASFRERYTVLLTIVLTRPPPRRRKRAAPPRAVPTGRATLRRLARAVVRLTWRVILAGALAVALRTVRGLGMSDRCMASFQASKAHVRDTGR